MAIGPCPMSHVRGFAGITLFAFALASCATTDSEEKHPPSRVEQGQSSIRLIVFVEATDQSSLNNIIEQKYLKPIYQRFASISQPFDLAIFPISGNTEAETPLLRFTSAEEWMTQEDEAHLAENFRLLREQYARIYPPESSYLVDVLGTTILLDSFLGTKPEVPTDVLYLSDMIQQEDISGYDFTEYSRGKSLERCREELEEHLGSKLRHRDLFSSARIHIVYIGVDTLRRGAGGSLAEIGLVTRNTAEIKTFWKKDFFGRFLGTNPVKEYSGSVEDALNDIIPPT